MAAGNTEKISLIPAIGKSYVSFKKELKMWETITSIDEKKRAPMVVMNLPHRAKSVALDIPLEELQNGIEIMINGETKKLNGIERLTKELDKIYLDDVETEKYKAYDSFRKFKRQNSVSVHEYILEFDKKLRLLKEYEIELPDTVLAYDILNNANLSEHNHSLATVTAKPLSYLLMKETLKSIINETVPAFDVQDSKSTKIKVEPEESSTFIAKEESNSETFFNRNGNFRGSSPRGTSYYRPSNTRSNYRGQSPRNFQSRNSNTMKTNPKDQFGNIMTCSICSAITHFARKCPEQRNRSFFCEEADIHEENVTLFQNTPKESVNSDTMKQFTQDSFGMAILDSGCNITVCGKGWLEAYLDCLSKEDKHKVKVEKSQVNFKFGDNKPDKSEKKYRLPAIIHGKQVSIETQVVEAEIPLLLSRQSMKKANMVIDYKNDTVQAFGVMKKINFTESGHYGIKLGNNLIEEVCMCSLENVILFNNQKDCKSTAIKLHKQFAHPTADKLKTFVKTSGNKDKDLMNAIDEVSESCDICKRYKRPSSRPVVSMSLAKDFNDAISMDLKIFDKEKNIYFQHAIDHKTRFSTAKVIKSKDKEVIVDSVFTHWINIFGPPKKILTDNGGEYVNEAFTDMCQLLGVHISTTGAESPWSNGIVERHHALIARNVSKILEENPKCRLETALAWACHSKNALSNIDGFSPYQLVFGFNPNIPSLEDKADKLSALEDATVSEKVAEHINAIYSARREQIKSETAEKIRRALSHQVRDVYSNDVKQGDLVYYKRDKDSRWRGPGRVIGTDNKVVFVRHGGFSIKCHIIHVVNVNDIYRKKMSKINEEDGDEKVPNQDAENFTQAEELLSNDLNNESPAAAVYDQNIDLSSPTPAQVTNEICSAKAIAEKKHIVISLEKRDINDSAKQEELEKWVKNDVFDEIGVDDSQFQESGISPINVTWVITNKEKIKARLVARGYQDEELQPTQKVSPTCRKESLRILLTLSASLRFKLKALDITSAFLQGKELKRLVYVIPPKEYKKKGVLWKLKKCVYGLCDAARQWYEEVKDTFTEAGIIKCPYDDAFFYWFVDGSLEGIMTIHVDDFIYCGTDKFIDHLHKCIFSKFNVGSQTESCFQYLGMQISQSPESHEVVISQNKYTDSLQTIQISDKRRNQKTHALNNEEFKLYRSLCGQLLWLSLQTRPDISYEVCILSNYLNDPNVENLVKLNKLVKKIKSDDKIDLKFKQINNINSSCKVLCYSDASYGSLPRNGSQEGYIILISDNNEKNKNPIIWKSARIDRVCRSSLEAECLGLLNALDHSTFIQKTLNHIIPKSEAKIVCHIDNKSLFDLLLGIKDPTEKRLIVVMAPVRDLISKDEIEIRLLKSKEMPADILTKHGVNGLNIRACLG